MLYFFENFALDSERLELRAAGAVVSVEAAAQKEKCRHVETT
jgi:hypothetical protein